MKKSTGLMIMLLVNIVMFFINYPKPDILIRRIEIVILVIGYFIVKQLEENGKELVDALREFITKQQEQ